MKLTALSGLAGTAAHSTEQKSGAPSIAPRGAQYLSHTLLGAGERGEHHVRRVDGVDEVGREGGALPGLHDRQVVRMPLQDHALQHRPHLPLPHEPAPHMVNPTSKDPSSGRGRPIAAKRCVQVHQLLGLAQPQQGAGRSHRFDNVPHAGDRRRGSTRNAAALPALEMHS